MKKLIFGALFCAMGISASAAVSDWGGALYYDSINQVVKERPQTERRVVFVGNSITEGWPVANAAFFTDNGFVGRGISGHTSYQFLVRFRGDAINLHPQIVVINAGTNDIAENTHPYVEDRTFENIITMVELAQANGILPVLSSVLPAAAFRWNTAITDGPDKIESINRRLAAYAAEHGIPYIDYYSVLVTDDGTRALAPAYTYDGVHPTPEGYTVMEKAALDVLLPLLAK